MKMASFVATLVAGLAIAPAYGQSASKSFTIGYLSHASGVGENEKAMRNGLRKLGYVEGHNLAIEWRFAKGDLSLHPRLAAELAALNVDCMVTTGVTPTRAAMKASRSIPIVMANASDDPVELGLVASLGRPGGNVTGFTDAGTDLAAKRLELLVEAVPAARRVAIVWDAGTPVGAAQAKATQFAAQRRAITLQSLPVRRPEDLGVAFSKARASGADAAVVVSYGFVVNEKAQVAALAIAHRLPVISTVGEMADAGSLLSYAPDLLDHYGARVPRYIGRVLQGASPAEMPVELPTKLELVINLGTAKALGAAVPTSMLVRADRVID